MCPHIQSLELDPVHSTCRTTPLQFNRFCPSSVHKRRPATTGTVPPLPALALPNWSPILCIRFSSRELAPASLRVRNGYSERLLILRPKAIVKCLQSAASYERERRKISILRISVLLQGCEPRQTHLVQVEHLRKSVGWNGLFAPKLAMFDQPHTPGIVSNNVHELPSYFHLHYSFHLIPLIRSIYTMGLSYKPSKWIICVVACQFCM